MWRNPTQRFYRSMTSSMTAARSHWTNRDLKMWRTKHKWKHQIRPFDSVEVCVRVFTVFEIVDCLEFTVHTFQILLYDWLFGVGRYAFIQLTHQICAIPRQQVQHIVIRVIGIHNESTKKTSLFCSWQLSRRKKINRKKFSNKKVNKRMKSE